MDLNIKTTYLVSAGSITILSRVRETSEGSEAAEVKVHTLRAHKRSIGNMAGEESAFSFDDLKKNVRSFRAEWGSPGVAKDAYTPQTEMLYTVTNGDHPDVPRILGYWDAIISSLHFRK